MEWEELDDEAVSSISVLAIWLSNALDNTSHFVLGIFPSSDPSEGVAYEAGDGNKVKAHLEKIAGGESIYYISLYRFNPPPQETQKGFYEKLEAETKIKTIDLQLAMLRLLPSKPDHESIESLSPPLKLKEGYSDFKNPVEEHAFDFLKYLYADYKLRNKETRE